MALDLPVKPRVRLPDALPEFDVPCAPHRGRAAIFAASFAAYAAVLVVGVGLTYGAWSLHGSAASDQSALSQQAPVDEAAAASTGSASTGSASTGSASTGSASTGSASTGSASTGSASTGPESTSPLGQAATIPAPPGSGTPASTHAVSAAAGPSHETLARPTVESLPSCEQAADTYKDDLTEGSTALPRDMTGSAYGALLDGPATQRLLTRCAARRWRHADVCVAVRGFRAVGVSVQTDPSDASVERCITNTIASLTFSHQPVLKIIRSEFGLMPER